MKKEIKIKPEVLLTLIKASGYDEENLFKKTKIPLNKIKEGLITFTQLKNLSKVLKRPLAAFFSDEVPVLRTIPDYRLKRERKLHTEVFLAQRKLEYLIEKMKELGLKKSSLPIFPQELSGIELAERFRQYLGIDLLKNKKPEKILQSYKTILEDKLKLIIIEQPLKPRKTKNKEISDDVRAFSIYADISGIVLNETDHPSIKLFSLFHEVCHLLRKSSGICSLDYEVEKDFKEEFYCNRFAAQFLVPEDDIKKELKIYPSLPERLTEVIDNLSKIYGVSKQVILLRLLYLNFISLQHYYEIKEQYASKEIKPQFGKRNWSRIYKNRVGGIVVKEVKSSLSKNEISFYEALNILDVKVNYAEKFLYE